MKKILVVLNNPSSIRYEYLYENNYNTDYIYSSNIINFSFNEILNFIYKYDIIFLGGGPQHLTKDKINNYPEFTNLFNIIKICEENNILLIGICLGFQIICYYYNCIIIKLNKIVIGTDFLELETLNYEIINNDKYLSKLNFNILKNSFSFHYDFVNYNINENINQNLNFIGFYENVPYICKHKIKNIFGFQNHPEITLNNIQNIINFYNVDFNINNITNITGEISKNFFETFIN